MIQVSGSRKVMLIQYSDGGDTGGWKRRVREDKEGQK